MVEPSLQHSKETLKRLEAELNSGPLEGLAHKHTKLAGRKQRPPLGKAVRASLLPVRN